MSLQCELVNLRAVVPALVAAVPADDRVIVAATLTTAVGQMEEMTGQALLSVKSLSVGRQIETATVIAKGERR